MSINKLKLIDYFINKKIEINYNGYIAMDRDRIFYATDYLGREGIYLLGDFYVGYSKNIINRLDGHAKSKQGSVLQGIRKWNARKSKLHSKGKNGKTIYKEYAIPVFYLCPNKEMERPFTEILKGLGFPIENDISRCCFNGVLTNRHTKKAESLLNQLENNSIT